MVSVSVALPWWWSALGILRGMEIRLRNIGGSLIFLFLLLLFLREKGLQNQVKGKTFPQNVWRNCVEIWDWLVEYLLFFLSWNFFNVEFQLIKLGSTKFACIILLFYIKIDYVGVLYKNWFKPRFELYEFKKYQNFDSM